MLTVRRRCATLAWAMSAMLGQACAPTVGSTSSSLRDVESEVAITIANETSRAMRTYLRAEHSELLLGTVPALATRTFRVPNGFTDAASEFQIEVRDRLGDVGLLTERFTLAPRRIAIAALSRGRVTLVTVR
jgi:hypothetical protein